MPDYDDILIPIKGQPINSALYGKKVRDYIIDLGIRMAIREAAESLPSNVSAYGNGINSMVGAAAAWTTMPSFPVVVQMTNPSTIFNLVCNVFMGAWMSSSVGDVRMGFALSGGLTVPTPTLGANQPVGWGFVPMTTQTTADQHMGFMQVVIPAGAPTVTFTAMGSRSNATSNAQCNYPSINVVPDRFTIP